MKNFDSFACSMAMPVQGFAFHSDTTLSTQARTHATAGVRPKPASTPHIPRAGHKPAVFQHLPK